MKNILNILKDFGIEIPEDKVKELEKAVNENYKTVAEFTAVKEQKETLENDIKQRDADLEELRKKVDSDSDAQAQLDEMTKKYEDLKNESDAQIKKQAYEFAVREKVGELNFSSTMAKNGFIKAVIDAGLKLEDGKLLGFDDFVKKTKEEDAGIFAEPSKPDNKPPLFTTGANGQGGKAPMTKEEILKIPNSIDRQKAIKENLDLFK